jgi:hypothetical protein
MSSSIIIKLSDHYRRKSNINIMHLKITCSWYSMQKRSMNAIVSMHTVAFILFLHQSPDIYYLTDPYLLTQAYFDCSHNILQYYYLSVPYHLKSNISPM